MSDLKIGNIALPTESVTHSFGLLAVRGAGKTNAARVLAEEFYRCGLPFVAIDPVGSWWGLRAGRDGTPKDGLSVAVLGGKHGDLPLHRNAGERIAELIVGTNLSCVLDLSEFESEADKKRFLLDFAQTLYKRNETARHIFLEEADDYIPQKPMKDELRLKRAWENIVRRGRSRGLGFTLITQRSAVVNKDVLTQVETLFVMRTTGPQDRAALDAWVAHNGSGITRKDLEAVPSLKSGEAFCWSPTLLGRSERMQFRLSRTFDSGATPKPGEAPRAATLADVDLGPLKAELAELDEPKGAADGGHAHDDALAAAVQRLTGERDDALSRVRELERAINTLAIQAMATIDPSGTRNISAPPDEPPVVHRDAKPAKWNGKATEHAPEYSANGPSRCARSILTALAQHGDLSLTQAAIIAGYASDSGGVRNAAGELRTGGLVEGSNAKLSITAAGRAATRDAPRLPTGAKLAEYWYAKLDRAERLILGEVVAAYPRQLSLKDAAKRAGYEPSSGGVRNAAGKLRTLALVHGGNGGMTADKRLV
jgi:hypothetical protein